MVKKYSKSELFLKKVNELNDISGFLNVYKHKTNNIKGFNWIYKFHEDGKVKHITNRDLLVLKHIVLSKNLPWKIID